MNGHKEMGLLTYSVEGRVVTLTAVGTPTEDERRSVYLEMCRDPQVAWGSGLLLDVRGADEPVDAEDVRHRTSVLVTGLGQKVRACAIVIPPHLESAAVVFQSASRWLGVEVELFHDEPDARRWLEAADFGHG